MQSNSRMLCRNESNQTLTYDDVMILFKKFQGTVRFGSLVIRTVESMES
jgi:hypothetical protein